MQPINQPSIKFELIYPTPLRFTEMDSSKITNAVDYYR